MEEMITNVTQSGSARVTVLTERIETLIIEARTKVVAFVNTAMVYTYYEIGRMIVEDEQGGEYRAEYGKKVMEILSERLTQKFGKGFSIRNIEQMRKFYLVYAPSEQIPQTLSAELNAASLKTKVNTGVTKKFTLSWSHYLKLMRISNSDERRFYEIEATQNHWSLRELERQFDSSLYERLALSRNKDEILQLSKQGQIIEKPQDLLKDPYILEFTGLPELPSYSESTLEQRLIDNIQSFLLELGKGFTFVGRQVQITFDEEHFFIDLVFYNRLLQAFVLIDLKRGKLKHQDIGQMQMYVNYYDRKVKLENEKPTIGLLICADKTDAVVEYSLPKSNNQIFASKYQTILPSKDQLKKVLMSK